MRNASSAHDAGAPGGLQVEIVPSVGHASIITSIAFSPNGAFVLSASCDMLKLWDFASRRLIRTFRADPYWGNPVSAAFAPDGQTVLATGTIADTDASCIRVWEIATGRLLRTIEGASDPLAISPDGAIFLTSGARTLELWNIARGELARSFQDHTAGVASVALSRDGACALSGSDDATMKLWEVASGRVIRTFAEHSSSVGAVAFSPDGTAVLSGDDDGTLKLWDASSGRLIRNFVGDHRTGIQSLAFSPDGSQIVSGSAAEAILWETGSGRHLHTFFGSWEHTPVAFSYDGKYVLVGVGYSVEVGKTTTGDVIGSLGSFADWVTAVAFSPDGTRIFSQSWDAVRLWDMGSGCLLRRVDSGDERLKGGLVVSGDGSRIATTRGVLDGSTGELLTRFKTRRDESGIEAVALSPDGTRVLSGGRDCVLRLWDASTGEQIGRFQEQTETNINCVAFSPDGRYAASGSHGLQAKSTLMLWDAAMRALVRSFRHSPEERPPGVSAIVFSPDGSRIVSAGVDGMIRLWDVETGELVRTLEGHTDWVEAVAFSSDGAQILSASWDTALKLWDADSSKLIRTFVGHTDRVESVAFSPDGQKVLSGGDDTSIRVWAARSGKLLATFFGLPSGDWLTVTPQGFFAGTPRGKDMLSAVRGLEVTAVDEALFNPDRVREALSGDPGGELDP